MGIVMEMLCKIRAGIIHFLYTKILKKYFFLFDPEVVHNVWKNQSVTNANNSSRIALGTSVMP